MRVWWLGMVMGCAADACPEGFAVLEPIGGPAELVEVAGAFQLPADGDVWLCPGEHVAGLVGAGEGDVTVHGPAVVEGGDGPVLAVAGGVVRVEDVTLTGGQAPEGGGVQIRGGGVGLKRSRVVGNVGGAGGGVWVGEGRLVLEEGTVVAHNEAAAGGGVFVGRLGAAMIRDGAVVADNQAPQGGGLQVDGHAWCEHGRIVGNTVGGAWVTGALVATGCDLGEPRADHDNLGGDLLTALGAWTFGGDASFTCTAVGCAP